jgi:serine/threonine protein kinase
LTEGWLRDEWAGAWSKDDEALLVFVGQHAWRGVEQSQNGTFDGREAFGDDDYELNGVTVAVPRVDTRDSIASSSSEPIFEFEGYTFYLPASRPKGYFAAVLEATKPSLSGGIQRFAAKCVPVKEVAVVQRELSIAERVSATDCLIAVFESFCLPADEAFGAFSGSLVQVLEWGETDLERFGRAGPLDEAEVLAVARDIATALSALHTKFGIVHADVRQANVIGRRTGAAISWRLADFNVASTMDSHGKAVYHGGSKICMPPDLVASPQETKPADDVWALGLALIQIALGEIWDQSIPISAEAADQSLTRISDELRAVVAPALIDDPNARATAAVVRALADQALGSIRT